MENKNNKEVKNAMNGLWAPALGIFGRFTAWIVAPVFIGASLGVWLDKKFNTEPWIFFISIAVSFVVSMIGVARNALDEYRKQEERDGEK
jgi:F0F1-type ATP synthase assembly protein I